MMTHHERRVAMIQDLRTSLTTATAMAVRFGVTPRTVYRDVAVLKDYGVPIEGEKGVGYVIRNGWALP